MEPKQAIEARLLGVLGLSDTYISLFCCWTSQKKDLDPSQLGKIFLSEFYNTS
jgi:hypothetical protein